MTFSPFGKWEWWKTVDYFPFFPTVIHRKYTFIHVLFLRSLDYGKGDRDKKKCLLIG